MQRQAEPFFLQDLVFLSSEIAKRMNVHVRSSAQLFVLARDQAFFKVQFISGGRAGDLGRIKTKEILYFPEKKVLLFNHTLTKSLRDGTSNVFALKRHADSSVCPVTAVEGRFPFDQKYRDFRSETEWNGKNSGKSFRKFRNMF